MIKYVPDKIRGNKVAWPMKRSNQVKEDYEAKPRRRYLPGIGSIAVSLALLVLILATISCSPEQVTPTPEPEGRKAALVDQVALTHPNPDFTDQALACLREAGFSVDVYEGEEITVEFYRTLPTKGYRLILFRTHSTNIFDVTLPDGTVVPCTDLDSSVLLSPHLDDIVDPLSHPNGPVVLYTSEFYEKNKYVGEQLTNRIGSAKTPYDNSPLYFVILSGFVSQNMVGRFENTLIIIGGCRSLAATDLAQAFVERGASAVVGWNEWVELCHNDQALLHLLRGLVVERLMLEQAVRRTMNEIGPDPVYESVLTYLTGERSTVTLWD